MGSLCMKTALYKNQQAFTLLKVLVAFLIFAFGMIGLGRLLISTVESNRDARRITAATMLAMDQLETLRSAALSETGYISLVDSTADQTLTEEGTVSVSGLYTRNWDVTANSPEIGSTEISVTVSWEKKTLTGADRDTRNITLKSIVVEPFSET